MRNDPKKVKAKKTHFNGYIFVDPRVEVGSKAILDEDYNNASEVIVMQLGTLFARVRVKDMEWSTMRNRLTMKDDEGLAKDLPEVQESGQNNS